MENVVDIYKSLNASFSIHILNSNIEGNEKKQVKLERKMALGVIGARVYFPKSILPISLDPRKSHDPQKLILPISLTKIPYPFTQQKSFLIKQRKKKNLTPPIKPKPKTQLRSYPKILIFDPNNKINQPNLFLDLLSKLKKLKVNYDKFGEEIIKMSSVKSKDQLADFLLKIIGSKALNNIVQGRFR